VHLLAVVKHLCQDARCTDKDQQGLFALNSTEKEERTEPFRCQLNVVKPT